MALILIPGTVFANDSQGNASNKQVIFYPGEYVRNGVTKNCVIEDIITIVNGEEKHEKIFYIPAHDKAQVESNIMVQNLQAGVMACEEADFDKFDYYKFFVTLNTSTTVKYGSWPNPGTAWNFIKVTSVEYGYSILPDIDMPGGVENAVLEVKCYGFDAPTPYGTHISQESGAISIPAPSNTKRMYYPPSSWKAVADVPTVTAIGARVTATVLNRVTGARDSILAQDVARGIG